MPNTEIGSFEGISSVIPTKINFTKSSTQGKLGQQITLTADVGVKQAGIPVTFNVTASEKLNKDQVFESVTNEEGIATFSYTQYVAGNDSVVAYPTGAPSVRDLGYVFWGVDTILAIEEVTKGETINNGANKTYKVTYKDPKTGKPAANETFAVSVLENINVTADKLKDVKVEGKDVQQLSNNTSTIAALIKTDAKGEATFTVSGKNSEATPVVFKVTPEYNANGAFVQFSQKYDASNLQAVVSKVKFAAVQAEYMMEIFGTYGDSSEAAIGFDNGRLFTIMVMDKNGEPVADEIVNIALNEDIDRSLETQTEAQLLDERGDYNLKKTLSYKTNEYGEIDFKVISFKTGDYATPIAWIDINSSNALEGHLDENEPFQVGPITYFEEERIALGSLFVSGINGILPFNKEAFDADDVVTVEYFPFNQSYEPMFILPDGYSHLDASFTIWNTGEEDIEVSYSSTNGNSYTQLISPNRSYTTTNITGTSLENPRITIVSVGEKTTSARVVASGKALPDKSIHGNTLSPIILDSSEENIKFKTTSMVTAPYTGYLKSFNPADTGTNSNSLWYVGKNPIKYTGSNVEYYGANGNQIFGETAWETYLGSLVGQDVTVSYSKDGEKTIFKVISAVTPQAANANTLVSYTPPAPENNAPTAKNVGTQTIAVGGTPLTFTASQLAEDEDAGDVLSVLAAYTGNNATATATVINSGASISVNPVAVGTTTVTAIVADNHGAQVAVTFDVNVTSQVFVKALGNPAIGFVEAAPASVTLTAPTVTTGGNLVITDGTTSANVNLTAGASVSDIVNAINSQAGTVVTAEANTAGTDIVITSKDASATTLSVDADATLAGNSIPTSGTPVTGTNTAATKAQFTFQVTGLPTVGKVITVSLGNKTYTYTATAADVAAGKTAADLATKIAAAITGDYTATAAGVIVTIEQAVAAPETGFSLSVSNN